MKISFLNLYKPQLQQRRNTEQHNQYDYVVQNRMPVLAQSRQDTVTFGAKIPSITAPTMEDLINKTKGTDILRFNILRLAKYKVPCPVCGHIMLDVDTFNKFEEKILSTTDPGKMLEYIGKLKTYLHPIESRIYSMMVSKHHDNPNMTFHQMLKEKLPASERKLIHEQVRTLTNISLLCRKLPEEHQKSVQELINETLSRLFDKRETSRFSRKVFIGKLEEILTKYDTNKISLLTTEILSEAAKLPTAYNNPSAFIVKYAKRNYHGANPDQKIALRMLSNSMATIEHIKAQKLNGSTTPENLALECACDNNRKGHESVFEQVILNPDMINHYTRYMDKLCELHLMGKVEKSYISQQNKTFCECSQGLLNADLSAIRTNKKRVPPANSDGITPTKEERRASHKEKIKKHKQSKKKENINKCNNKRTKP